MSLKVFEEAVERVTGCSIAFLRDTPLDELRAIDEKKRGHPVRFVSVFPWAGRGNVLRDRLLSRKEVDDAYNEAIHQLPDTP